MLWLPVMGGRGQRRRSSLGRLALIAHLAPIHPAPVHLPPPPHLLASLRAPALEFLARFGTLGADRAPRTRRRPLKPTGCDLNDDKRLALTASHGNVVRFRMKVGRLGWPAARTVGDKSGSFSSWFWTQV